ncbi:MAG: signal recognition particle-docking protein FtsY [Rhodococcus sp.]|nr:signal recognition particle-docking protein FtsY [Rhodococcus sp. (in: high G+C Gram-positive bacteria)]
MTTAAWIVLAAALAVLLVVLVVGLVLYRRRRISLTTAEKPVDRELDRSGGYQAGSGFSFSQGTATKEPVSPPRKQAKQKPAAPPAEPVLPEPAEPDAVEPEPTEPEPAESGPTESGPGEPEPTQSTATAEEVAIAETLESAGTQATGAGVDFLPPLTIEPEAPSQPEQPQPEPAAPAPAQPEQPQPVLDDIAPTSGRLERLRGRLSRSQNAIGKSVLGLLGGGDLDEDSWEEIEDTLLIADLGTATTTKVVERLREEMATRSVRTEDQVRELLREVLVDELQPDLDRSVRALPHDDHPAVLLVVGVNGTGKTTTTGKLARVLVADGRRVLLGAADTFRAAAADQLQTWAERVGAEVVRGKEGADPAAIAFDAVSKGIDEGVDVVLIDTAGRLHTKTGLMDELGKVKRVVEKKASVDDVLLVLDATIGQNGLAQARVFADVVDISGVVLTKLDGTAKGGIVFQVQHELGVPVKLVGLGEGADDLAPFEPGAFVDALLG